MMHINEPPRSPRQANPEVPDPLDALTLKLLAKDPEDRYPSAAALANDLERVRSGLPLAGADAEKTARMAAPPPPPSAAPEGMTAKTAVRPPAAAPVGTPGRGGRDRRGPRRALTALLLGVALIAGVAWALTRDFDLSGGNQPGQEQPATAQVQVPDLTRLGEAEAVAALQNGGLEAGVQRRESSWEEFELVVDQSPDSGERVEEGETVTVHVGDGPSVVTVPDLVWESQAAGTLEYEGLALGAAEYVPSDFPAGQVVETRPAEGTEVDRGTPVTIVVSTGPRQVPVSDEDEKRREEEQKEAEKRREEQQKEAEKQ
jgi:serine/threonine-protein kinase